MCFLGIVTIDILHSNSSDRDHMWKNKISCFLINVALNTTWIADSNYVAVFYQVSVEEYYFCLNSCNK